MTPREQILVRSVQLAVVAILFGAWYFATRSTQVLSLFLPPPERVWREMQVITRSGQLWSASAVTLLTLAKAYLIAVLLGIGAGFAVARSEAAVRLFEPLLSSLFAIPITLLFPVFVLFFGIGTESKVAYAAVYAFFPIVLNTIAGFSSVDRLYLRAVRSMGASRWEEFRHVYLPAALPVTVTGLRIGFVICIASVLGGETLASAAGVGHVIAYEGELMNTARMYAWIVFVVLATLILNLLAFAAEARGVRQ